jgi:uncharacterized protein (DUF488 family)
MTFWTIGHSNQPLANFLANLAAAEISVVADLRTFPQSTYANWFNAAALGPALKGAQIAYVPMGEQLGGRPQDSALYEADGRVSYQRMAQTPAVQAGLNRLKTGLETGHRIVLLCTEEDPLGCHRFLLVSRLLEAEGFEILHLRADGRVQTSDEVQAALAGYPARKRDELQVAWETWLSVHPIKKY